MANRTAPPTEQPDPHAPDPSAETAKVVGSRAQPDVLVENRTRGNRVGVVSRAKEGTSKGGVQEYDTEHLILPPGLTFVDAAMWARHAPSLAPQIQRSDIVVYDDWQGARDSVRREAVSNTGDERALRRLLEHETDDKFALVIEKQIEAVKRGAQGVQRAQAAHSRL